MHTASNAGIALACLLACAAAGAAPLAPNSGALTVSGTLADHDGGTGRFTIQATLRDGSFTGTATLELAGATVSGALLPKRSYLENGSCHFRFENGRARAEIGGKCDSASLDGHLDAFLPGVGMKLGEAKGAIALAGGAPAPEAAGTLPSGKLVCAFNEPRLAFKLGETTQYSLRYSNMASLVLQPGGAYLAGSGGGGRYVRQGDKVRLASGTWAGAVGTLENDRSGKPAVVFHIEENKRPDGVHIVDPYSTHCTSPR